MNFVDDGDDSGIIFTDVGGDCEYADSYLSEDSKTTVESYRLSILEHTKQKEEIAARNPYSLFPTRDCLLAYETAFMFAENMNKAIAEEKLDVALDILQLANDYLVQEKSVDKPSYDFSVRFSASWVYCSIVTVGISILESQKRYLLLPKFYLTLIRNTGTQRPTIIYDSS